MKLITRQVPTYIALIAASLALLLLLRALGLKYQLMIAVGVLALLLTEPLALRRSRERGKLAFLAASVGSLIVAATFSALDLSRVFCDPNDHVVQGHAIWHLFSALSLGLAHAHYASLPKSVTS
jgi:predicted membrane channel-forming protein YqfA (hemolysin III family)